MHLFSRGRPDITEYATVHPPNIDQQQSTFWAHAYNNMVSCEEVNEFKRMQGTLNTGSSSVILCIYKYSPMQCTSLDPAATVLLEYFAGEKPLQMSQISRKLTLCNRVNSAKFKT